MRTGCRERTLLDHAVQVTRAEPGEPAELHNGQTALSEPFSDGSRCHAQALRCLRDGE